MGKEEFVADWIKINKDDLKKLKEMAKEEGSISSFDINDEQIKMLQEVAKVYNYVKVGKNLGTEEINGKKTWHYQMVVDKQALKEYFKKALDIVLAKVTEIPAEDKELVSSIIEGYIDNTDVTSEIWIEKSDKLIYRSVLNLQMPSFFGIAEKMNKIDRGDIKTKQQKVEQLKNVFNKVKKTLTFNIIVDSTDFNKKVEIEAPVGAVDIVDLLKTARVKSMDAERIADIKQIQTALKMYYSDKGSYPIADRPVVLGQGDYKFLIADGWSATRIAKGAGITSLKAPVAGRYAFKLEWSLGDANVNYYDARRVINLTAPAKKGDTVLKLDSRPLVQVSYMIFDTTTQKRDVLSLSPEAVTTQKLDAIQLNEPLLNSYTTSAQIVPLLGSYWGQLPTPVGPVDLGTFQKGEEIKIGFITQYYDSILGPFLSLDPKYFFYVTQPTATSFTVLIDDGLNIGSLDGKFKVYQASVTSPYPITIPSVKTNNPLTFSLPYPPSLSFSYMSDVPSDPGTQGWSYSYCSATNKEPNECSTSGESYIITFQLERGIDDLSAGQHIATPNGIQ